MSASVSKEIRFEVWSGDNSDYRKRFDNEKEALEYAQSISQDGEAAHMERIEQVEKRKCKTIAADSNRRKPTKKAAAAPSYIVWSEWDESDESRKIFKGKDAKKNAVNYAKCVAQDFQRSSVAPYHGDDPDYNGHATDIDEANQMDFCG